MGQNISAAMKLAGQGNEPLRDPLEWLLVYSIELNGGIDKDWIEKSGLGRGQAESLLAANPEVRREVRQLQRIGRMFSLRMLFDLLRERAAQMLAAASKPAEIRSLLGTLSMLRADEEKRQLVSLRDAQLLQPAQNGNGAPASAGVGGQS
ncbi:hypothetical protein KDL29_11485 [bacterium]|nr:hypothetical protein [bacterium]